jgi:hypothetical protein
MSPTIETDYRSVAGRVHVGDLFTVHGVEIGRIECIEGNFFGKVTMHVIPNLLYWAKLLAFRGRTEGKPRHFTAEQLPSHDPPVAWHIDHLEEVLGLDVLACPGVEYGTVKVLAPGGYMDPDPLVLPAEPGRRPK